MDTNTNLKLSDIFSMIKEFILFYKSFKKLNIIQFLSRNSNLKCQKKYLLLYLETDETYRGTDNNQTGSHWTKIDNSFVNEFKKLNPKPAATAVNVREILDAVDALLKL